MFGANQVRVEELTALPAMDAGAPLPLVLAAEGTVVLSYWTTEPERIALVVFHGVHHQSLGTPNDESLHGHPLYGAGIKHYRAFVVEHSPLIASLAKINSVHPYHDASRYEDLKHYFIAFHDSTFECVARSFSFTTQFARDNDQQTEARLHQMIGHLQPQRRSLTTSTT